MSQILGQGRSQALPSPPLVNAHVPLDEAKVGGTLATAMRTVGVALLFVAFRIASLAVDFSANGQADAAGWLWFKGGGGKAQWRFYELAWDGQYLSVELLLQSKGWHTPPPPSLGVVLRFSTFCSSLSRSMELQRVGERGEFVAYFGQLILARRELDFGGYLDVELWLGGSDPEWAVYPSSLRVRGERTAYATQVSEGGAGGPLVLSPTPPLVVQPLPSFGESSAQGFREGTSPEDAPFLRPGRYQGQLGWPGPGEALDAQDWLRFNLNTGHRVEIQVFSPQPVSLRLLDPAGQEVGRVNGAGQIGLIYQAKIPGGYQACLALVQGMPSFTYTLDLLIWR